MVAQWQMEASPFLHGLFGFRPEMWKPAANFKPVGHAGDGVTKVSPSVDALW